MTIKPSVSDWGRAALVCREIAELPDRTSSDLNPDEMIVTGDELAPMIAAALAEERARWFAQLRDLPTDLQRAMCKGWLPGPQESATFIADWLDPRDAEGADAALSATKGANDRRRPEHQ